MQFKELGLSEELLSAVKSMGFDEMTEIQEKSIPVIPYQIQVKQSIKNNSIKYLIDFSELTVQGTEKPVVQD